MSDYSKVADALAAGADPKMLCETCPWDRFCITPPQFTRGELDQQMKRMVGDEGLDENPMGALVKTMVSSAILSGRDTASDTCPVFSLRLRSSQGRVLVDSIRAQMRAFDDSEVVA